MLLLVALLHSEGDLSVLISVELGDGLGLLELSDVVENAVPSARQLEEGPVCHPLGPQCRTWI